MTQMEVFGKSDGKPSYRETVLTVFASKKYDETVDYDSLIAALGVSDIKAAQRAVNGAKLELERQQQKALVAIPNVGYRVVNPSEHFDLAKNHQARATRTLKRATSKLQNVDVNALSPGERAAITLGLTALSLQQDYMRRANIRHQRLEKRVASLESTTTHTTEQVTSLRSRMDMLERKLVSDDE